MCGISGLWLFKNNQDLDLTNTIEKMANALSHRGPDDSGIWIDRSVGIGLGHRRLSIVDLSTAGHQPMASKSGRFIIVFNGEIYNHDQLRRHIQTKTKYDQKFIGDSDTETLLSAIEVLGIKKALDLSKGMFAFALWDRKEKELTLVRDRFGEKPLYWGILNGHGITFSSDVSAFREVRPFSNPLDRDAIDSYMRLGYIKAPKCIYKGIQQLLPGHLVTIKANSSETFPDQLPESFSWWNTQEKYFEYAFNSKKIEYSSVNEKLQDLKDVLKEAIRIQSIADVPLGSFLSGGIDSSLTTALLQENSKSPIRSFTVSFPDEPKFDEGPCASEIAKVLKTNHTEVALTAKDAQALIPLLPNLYSEPFADSSQVPTHLLCREARKSGLTVALTGDGGDELFGGYNRHRLAPLLHRRLGFTSSPIRKILKSAIQNAPFELLGLSSDGLAQQKRQKLASAIGAANSLEAIYAVLLESNLNEGRNSKTISPLPTAPTPEEQIMLADLINYLPFDILVKVDRASMAVGLETRAPFLDPSVAQTAWSLPLQLKIRTKERRYIGKWALKELLKEYLPPELYKRPKTGFAMPIGSWLRGPLKPWADDLLNRTIIKKHRWFNSAEIEHIWNQHLSGNFDHIGTLWPVLMAHSWLERWG